MGYNRYFLVIMSFLWQPKIYPKQKLYRLIPYGANYGEWVNILNNRIEFRPFAHFKLYVVVLVFTIKVILTQSDFEGDI